MSKIHDEEFGDIPIRRSAKATNVRIRVAPDGTLRASLPLYAPLFLVRRLLKTSRQELRGMLDDHQADIHFKDGMQIGKSHTLVVQPTTGPTSAARHGLQIIVKLAESDNLETPLTKQAIRQAMITALRIEAKSYLPKRLAFIDQAYGFHYTKLRFSHASGRWGSCSSSGTISLNIALMKLPFELIDYVLIHELSHTRHMNHSQEFWQLVEVADPNYKHSRRALKLETPSI